MENLESKLSKATWKALVNTTAELIDDPRSAREIAIEFDVDQSDVEDLQRAIREG